MTYSFAIVGCGSTAPSFLHRHLDHVENGEANANVIYLFEMRDVLGPGAAYAPDVKSNILNTKTEFITPFLGRPGHFKSWLDANRRRWQRIFPDFPAPPESYAPRPLFGCYLADQMKAIIRRAASLNVQIVTLHAEVCDIESRASNLIVTTKCGLAISVQTAFLFCGTLSRSPSFGHADPRIHDTPYPIADLQDVVDRDETVGIIGARLSAIDTVIALIENGHRGLIRMHSRSGYFPAVRGSQGRITNKYFSEDGVRRLLAEKRQLEINDIISLFCDEMKLHDPHFSEKVLPLPTPPADLANYLREEIEASLAPRPWQAILYATNGFIEEVWRALSPRARNHFMTDYFSLFMAYRVSIPPENARKILNYIIDGRLEFVGGPTSEPQRTDGHLLLHHSKQTYRYDRIVYTIGTPRKAELLNSDLLSNLFEKGIIAYHPYGGVCIDPNSYRVLGSNGQNPEIYTVGELTAGENFFTSALEINARHAYRCADALNQQRFRKAPGAVEEISGAA